MKDIVSGFSAQTSVGVGAFANSLCVIAWWVFSLISVIDVPDAIVAASVGLVAAALQYIIPHRANKKARAGDKTDA